MTKFKESSQSLFCITSNFLKIKVRKIKQLHIYNTLNNK